MRSRRSAGGKPPVAQRHVDVVEDVEVGDQVEALEDEADLLVADARHLAVRQAADVLAVERVRAARRTCRGARRCSGTSSCPSPTAPSRPRTRRPSRRARSRGGRASRRGRSGRSSGFRASTACGSSPSSCDAQRTRTFFAARELGRVGQDDALALARARGRSRPPRRSRRRTAISRLVATPDASTTQAERPPPLSRNGPRGSLRTPRLRLEEEPHARRAGSAAGPRETRPSKTTVPFTWLSFTSGEIAVTWPGYSLPSYEIRARRPGARSARVVLRDRDLDLVRREVHDGEDGRVRRHRVAVLHGDGGDHAVERRRDRELVDLPLQLAGDRRLPALERLLVADVELGRLLVEERRRPSRSAARTRAIFRSSFAFS